MILVGDHLQFFRQGALASGSRGVKLKQHLTTELTVPSEQLFDPLMSSRFALYYDELTSSQLRHDFWALRGQWGSTFMNRYELCERGH